MTQDDINQLLMLYLLINSCVHYVLCKQTYGKLKTFDL